MNVLIEKMISRLLEYDVISFDIFDTLITRKVLHPKDMFLFVEKQVNNQYHFGENFHTHRLLAEKKAYQKYKSSVNLDIIYDLLKDFNYDKKQCNLLKRLELETERDFIIPRKDMLYILKQLLSKGKRIVLISDMYLNSREINDLLNLCGYPLGLTIWVSSEKKADKATGTLWVKFFETVKNEKTIHIGDNEWSDVYRVKTLGHEAILVKNPYKLFTETPFFSYISKYDNGEISNSLLLGILCNEICFNSPFGTKTQNDIVMGLWLGPVFGCFMDWLIKTEDESILLFVTREGYVFLPMYEAYCNILEHKCQKHVMFYASRTATSSAAIVSETELKDILQIRYSGTIGNFTKSRLNFALPCKDDVSNIRIELPKQQKLVMDILNPYYYCIFDDAKEQNLAYRTYLKKIREKMGNLPFTIIDIGYTGTAQYNLSKILKEKISGKYLFLDELVLPSKLDCVCKCLSKVTDRIHPIYENLLFLEAAMQVPYGQLRKMLLDKENNIQPVFNSDYQMSQKIKLAQQAFLNFVKMEAEWTKKIGSGFKYDFNLAEDIWIIMIQYNILPDSFFKEMWLSDNFSGSESWIYDVNKQMWISKNRRVPIIFSLDKSKNKLLVKYRIKNFVKKHIPRSFYESFKYIWIKFIK